MHHHDYCPCPPAQDATPQHCHTDDAAPPMFFDPTTMFSWAPTAAAATTTSSSRTYRHNARHDAVRVDVPPPSTTTDDPPCEDTPCGKCAMVILSCLIWAIIITLIVYAVKT